MFIETEDVAVKNKKTKGSRPGMTFKLADLGKGRAQGHWIHWRKWSGAIQRVPWLPAGKTRHFLVV